MFLFLLFATSIYLQQKAFDGKAVDTKRPRLIDFLPCLIDQFFFCFRLVLNKHLINYFHSAI